MLTVAANGDLNGTGSFLAGVRAECRKNEEARVSTCVATRGHRVNSLF